MQKKITEEPNSSKRRPELKLRNSIYKTRSLHLRIKHIIIYQRSTACTEGPKTFIIINVRSDLDSKCISNHRSDRLHNLKSLKCWAICVITHALSICRKMSSIRLVKVVYVRTYVRTVPTYRTVRTVYNYTVRTVLSCTYTTYVHDLATCRYGFHTVCTVHTYVHSYVSVRLS